MVFYRNILSQAWKNTWRNKYLWFFGLFAALLGNGGELEIIFRGFDNNMSNGIFSSFWRITETGIFSKEGLSNVILLMGTEPASVFLALAILFIFLLLGLFLIWLMVISQTAIVHNSARVITGKKHDLKNGLEAGIKKFWPVFSLNVVLKLAIYIIFALISLPILSSLSKSYFSTNSFLFIVLFLLFIPVAIILSFIIKYAIAFSVIKGQRILEAVKSGWQLFIKNWIVSLEMAFVLFLINLLVGICLIILFLVIAVPFVFIILMFTNFVAYFNFWFLIMTAFVVLIVATAMVGSVLATFQISSWTMLFIELIGKGSKSKIERILGKN